ncbi:MAG TPA: filamentous hemagglutinin N-terminal domain-containing protein [Steroidobacteraceae bacterium]
MNIQKSQLLSSGRSRYLSAAVSAILSLAAAGAHADPHNGTVTNGSATISTPQANLTQIDQSSHSASIDWQSFDVSAQERVIFNQPSASAVALNRIQSQNPSQILGSIDANGRIFLINPNGIVFGASARINVGSLVASSLDLTSADAESGHYAFATAAAQSGAIINNGQITAASGGAVALLGGSVLNNGLIVANYGSVNLGAGRAATLDFTGDGLARFQVDAGLLSNSSGSAVNNTGEIVADGGQVLLTAKQANDVIARAVNNDGVIRAARVENVGGRIRLLGPEGSVVNSGTLDAAGVGASSTGGDVQVSGAEVALTGTSVIDVSGNAGGGSASIGGGFHGADASILNAQQTDVQSGAVLRADSLTSGDAGKVVVWSDGATTFNGEISAQAKGAAGNGGQAEVSGREQLSIGGHAWLQSEHGIAGTLLLDPGSITIVDGNNTAATTPFNSINDGWIINQLSGSSVVVQTSTSGDNATQDLLVDGAANIAWANANTLTLLGTNSVMLAVGSKIANTGTGSLTLQSGGAVTINGTITLAGGLSVTAGGDIVQSAPISADGVASFTAGAGKSVLLGNVANSFGSTVAIGASSGSLLNVTLQDLTAIDLQPLTITGNLNVAAGGDITQSGTLDIGGTSVFTAAGGQSVILGDTSNVFTGIVTFAASGTGNLQNVTLQDSTALDLRALTIDGNLTVGANALTQSGALSVQGNSSFTAAGGQSIALGNANNLFTGTVTLAANGGGNLQNVTLADTTALDLRTLTIGGFFTASSDGALTQSGALVVGGNSNFTAGNGRSITLSNSGNAFTGTVSLGAATGNLQNVTVNDSTALDLQALTIGGDLTIDASAITQSGALNVTGNSSFTAASGQSVSLNNTSNNFVGTVGLAASGGGHLQNVTVNNAVGLDMQALTIDGNLIVGASSVTQSGALVVGGTSSFTAASGQSILLGDASNAFTGTVTLAVNGAGNLQNVTVHDSTALDLQALAIDGNLDVAATAITQSGALNVAGSSSFAANAGQSILLMNASNLLTGAVSFAANTSGNLQNVTLQNSTAIDLQGLTLSGNLIATATGGISQSGALIVGGTASFTATNGQSIVLGNAGNQFTGAVSFAASSGNLQNVTVTDGNALQLQALAISGNLTATSGGSLTQSGALIIGGNSAFTADAGQSIILNSAGNSFAGTVNFASGGPGNLQNVTVSDSNALDLRALTIDGALTVTAGGALSQSGGLSIGGAAQFKTLNDAGAAITINGTNSFGSVQAAVRNAADTTNAAASVVINESNSTVLGNMQTAAGQSVSVTSGGAISALASTAVTTGSLSLIAGGDIGSAGTAIAVVAPNGSISASSSGNVHIAYTGGVGSTVAFTQVVAGTGGDVDLVSDGNIRVADVRAGGSVSLTSSGGSILDDSVGGAGSQLVANVVSLHAAGSIGEAAGVGAGMLDLQAGSVSASAQGGGIYLDQAQGDLGIGQLSATGPVSVQATAGSIVDDPTDATVASIESSAGGVQLRALNNIGTVTDLSTRQGAPIGINTHGGPISAQVTSAAGQINLGIAGGSSLTAGAGAISAGGAGRLLIQSTGDLSLSTFDNALSGFSEVGFSSDATLRLPDSSTGLLAGSLTTLFVRGATDVVRTGRVFDLGAGHLVFESGGLGGDATLNTNVNTLDATIGNGASLSVVQAAGTLALGSISAGGNVSIRATTIADDGDLNSITRVTAGNIISLQASNGVGAEDGTAGGRIDTAGNTVTVAADAGPVFISHLGDLQISGTVGGGLIDVSAPTGSITVNSTLRSTGPMTLTAGTDAGGAGSIVTGNITLAGVAQTDGTMTLTARGGGAIADAADTSTHLIAKDTNLSATSIGAQGNALNIDTGLLNASVSGGLYASAANSVQLGSVTAGDAAISANGSITDDGDAQTRVVADSLALSAASIGAAGAGNEIGTTVNRLSANASNGGIYIGQNGGIELGTVSAAGTGNDIAITASGAITDDGDNATRVSGGNLTLSATSIGSAAAGGEIDTQVSSLTATASGGGIYIGDAANLQLNTVTAAGNDVVLSAAGTLTDDGTDTTKVTGSNVSLTAGAVGTTDSHIDTAADVLSVNASSGGVYIDETDSVTLADVRSSGSGNTVNLRTANNGNVIVQSLVTQGGAVNLTAGGTGSLNVTGTLESNNGVVNLTSGDALAVPGLDTGTGSAVLHTVNDVNVGTITASSISITSDTGSVILGTANAGTGTVVITANNGTITDNTATSVTAGQATLTAKSIGSADNPLDVAIDTLTANTSAGGIFIADTVGLTVNALSATGPVSLATTGAFNQVGNITSSGNEISVLAGSIDMDPVATTVSSGADITYIANGGDANIAVLDAAAGRVLVIAADNVFSSLDSASSTTNVLGSAVEVRAGGLGAASGEIGAAGSPFAIATPGGAGQNVFLIVPAVNGIQTTTPSINYAGSAASVLLKGYSGSIGALLFDKASAFTPDTVLLNGESIVPLQNGRVAVNTDSLGAAKQALSSGVISRVNIDWAAFDPNVSLFGTLDPALKLPSDQVDDVVPEANLFPEGSGLVVAEDRSR